jgi:hypothetical protein
MSFTQMNSGNTFWLKGQLGIGTAPGNLHWHLYSNNHTPAVTDTLGNYTELSGVGYAVQVTQPTDWTVATVSNVTTATAPNAVFSFSGAVSTIYGYYLTDASDSTLLAAELFSAVQSIPSGGGTITLQAPAITLNSC